VGVINSYLFFYRKKVEMYKFYANPNQAVMSKTSNKMIFRFDTKGEFITDDPIIINRAKGYFDYLEFEADVVGEKIKGNAPKRVLTITTKEEKKKEKKAPTYKEMQTLYAEKTGKSAVGKSKADILKELED